MTVNRKRECGLEHCFVHGGKAVEAVIYLIFIIGKHEDVSQWDQREFEEVKKIADIFKELKVLAGK